MGTADRKSRKAEELMADFIIDALGDGGGDDEKSERIRRLSRGLNFRPPAPGGEEKER
ncbi:MAG TPA: hypothetical protein PLI51_09095 [bacterium]|nr:hypothetical protein [bacterium]HPQ66869.1 hypothetical protein [bacterium]